jgi:hypothetical protein
MEHGSRNSSTLKTTSKMFRMARSLRSLTSKMVKVKTSESLSSHTNSVRNGKLIMLIKLKTERPLDFTFLTKFILVEHSSSGQECQCRESLLLLVEETWSSRLTTDKTTTRSSSLIQLPRLSSQLLKTPSLSIFKAAVAHPISKSGTPMQDGSNFSSMITELLSISRMEEQWMSLVTEIEMVRT